MEDFCLCRLLVEHLQDEESLGSRGQSCFGILQSLHVLSFGISTQFCGLLQSSVEFLQRGRQFFELLLEGILLSIERRQLCCKSLDICEAMIAILFCLAQLQIAESFLGGLGSSLGNQTLDQLLDELLDFEEWISLCLHWERHEHGAFQFGACSCNHGKSFCLSVLTITGFT